MRGYLEFIPSTGHIIKLYDRGTSPLSIQISIMVSREGPGAAPNHRSLTFAKTLEGALPGSSKPTRTVGLNILLVGAAGHKVTIYEQTPVLGEVGAGIQIPSNSTRILFELGLEPYLKPYVTSPESISFRRWQNRTVIGKTRLVPDFIDNFHAPYYVIHRADFHSALCRKAKDMVVNYDPRLGSITLEDGTSHTGDLVVAADGIKSVARKVVLNGEEMPFLKPGFAAYRAVVDVNRMIGDSRHVMTYTIGAGKAFNTVLSHRDTSDPATWDVRTGLQDMKVEFQGWDPVLTKIIGMVEKTLKWPLMSGAAMAVEDGVALARSLSHMRSREQLSEALAIFEKVRIVRTSQMQEASLLNGQLWRFADGPLQEARDAAMAREVEGLPFSQSPNQWSDPATQMWCYGYETEGEN
ncbi:putative salicylate hydroxylase [Aspergillus novofumigatus IBT 16806]|uniref:FAD/NAD(P)-binding domain-containing protein n=1 Tax=Aspergillus novofumigatus (strain IBT 16806) TaxID=1392255 RepID=A0A2I1C7V9_ASPN1|nr:FAD/NAD(P)-binding domain-containing protein [Aspergillus novofumigatus IBT 16806]PKX93724.1 FAD/NAD(P)-binding domain-containing protein [Aspergillus novofumigatus IBT 16806]